MGRFTPTRTFRPAGPLPVIAPSHRTLARRLGDCMPRRLITVSYLLLVLAVAAFLALRGPEDDGAGR